MSDQKKYSVQRSRSRVPWERSEFKMSLLFDFDHQGTEQ